jgi:hypothetical protein
VKVHSAPPETVNPLCVVVGRPTSVTYNTAAFGIDEATLPLLIVGGIETEDRVEALKDLCRQTIYDGPRDLGGVVSACYPSEERNWRNYTGGGGVQLLIVELILTIYM